MCTYEISDDPTRINIDVIHGYLTQSYWSPGVPRAIVERAILGSLCFGVYAGAEQVGFARVVTDKATFAYLADVFILESHRGQGLSKKLMASICAHPELQGLRRFLLVTKDAHRLYAQFGFGALTKAPGYMEILRPDVYQLR